MARLGRFLREIRGKLKQEHSGYSLRDVAARIGLHHSYLGKLEKGDKTSITEERLHALAREYGVDKDLLLALAGRLTEEVSEEIYYNQSAFHNFIAKVHNSASTRNPRVESHQRRVDHRISELETLNRLLRDEINKRQQLELSLKQEQLERNTILSNLRDVVIYYLDTDLSILWSSPNAQHLFGEKALNGPGESCQHTLSEICGDCKTCPAKASLKTGDIYENSYLSTSGKSWLTRSVPIKGPTGEIEKILLSANDVTQLITAREEVQQGKNLSYQILQDLPALICRFTTDGTILYVNDEYCDYYSKTKEEMIGANFLDFVPEKKRGEVWAKFTALSRETPSTTYEHVVVTPNGDIRWQKWTERLVYDSYGIECYQAIGQDITDEFTMRQQNTLLASIIKNTSNICVIKDLELRVIATNMAYATAAGHQNVEELIGKTDAEIFGVSPDTDPIKGYMEDERLVQTFSEGEVLDRHEEVLFPDGSTHLYHTRKFPIYDNEGKLIATANISTDLTH